MLNDPRPIMYAYVEHKEWDDIPAEWHCVGFCALCMKPLFAKDYPFDLEKKHKIIYISPICLDLANAMYMKGLLATQGVYMSPNDILCGGCNLKMTQMNFGDKKAFGCNNPDCTRPGYIREE